MMMMMKKKDRKKRNIQQKSRLNRLAVCSYSSTSFTSSLYIEYTQHTTRTNVRIVAILEYSNIVYVTDAYTH